MAENFGQKFVDNYQRRAAAGARQQKAARAAEKARERRMQKGPKVTRSTRGK
jgi:hypothetical protein